MLYSDDNFRCFLKIIIHLLKLSAAVHVSVCWRNMFAFFSLIIVCTDDIYMYVLIFVYIIKQIFVD